MGSGASRSAGLRGPAPERELGQGCGQPRAFRGVRRVNLVVAATVLVMDENRARRVTDTLRERGIDAHLEKGGVDKYGVRIALGDGRQAVWGMEGTSSLEAEVLLDGDLVGFVPEIPGSGEFTEQQIVDAIARADYSEPEGHERATAPPPSEPLAPEGGVFRRFMEGRY